MDVFVDVPALVGVGNSARGFEDVSNRARKALAAAGDAAAGARGMGLASSVALESLTSGWEVKLGTQGTCLRMVGDQLVLTANTHAGADAASAEELDQFDHVEMPVGRNRPI